MKRVYIAPDKPFSPIFNDGFEEQPFPIPSAIPIDPSTYCTEHFSDSEDSTEIDDSNDEDLVSLYNEDFYSFEELVERAIFRLSHLYMFLSRIHGHTNSVVYSAIDKKTNKRVAIKVKIHNFENDPMEVRVLSKIIGVKNCQQIVAYYRFESCVAVVSELSKEHSFRRSLYGNTSKQKKFMLQLVSALNKIHALGIIYRDVKPSNLLWDDDKELLTVIDFDLSTFNRKQHDRYAGTEGYEAPEMLKIEELEGETDLRYNEKIDIYSAGVVLGQILFKCSEADVTHKKVRKWKNKCRKSADTDPAKSLFLKMTEHNPKNRLSAVDILKHTFLQEVSPISSSLFSRCGFDSSIYCPGEKVNIDGDDKVICEQVNINGDDKVIYTQVSVNGDDKLICEQVNTISHSLHGLDSSICRPNAQVNMSGDENIICGERIISDVESLSLNK